MSKRKNYTPRKNNYHMTRKIKRHNEEMKEKKEKRRRKRKLASEIDWGDYGIMALAFLNRYGSLLFLLIIPLIIIVNKNTALFTIQAIQFIYATSFLLYGILQLLGYLLKWRFLYCSLQDLHKKKMTPNDIDWSTVSKGEAYGIPAILIVLGAIGVISAHFISY